MFYILLLIIGKNGAVETTFDNGTDTCRSIIFVDEVTKTIAILSNLLSRKKHISVLYTIHFFFVHTIPHLFSSFSFYQSISHKLPFSQSAFQSSLRDKIKELFGEVGAGHIGSSTMVRFMDGEYHKIVVVRTTRYN